MKIEEAQEENGRAWLPEDKTSKRDEYVICVGGIMTWVKGPGAAPMNPVAYCLLKRDDWQPYHEVKEIRPEVGELWWQKGYGNLFIVKPIKIDKLHYKHDDGSGGVVPSSMVHGEFGYKRLWPEVEDESIERVEIEGVHWQKKDNWCVPFGMKRIGEDLINRSPMKMILEMSKHCSHGKGLNDYCEPCGRINGG